MNSLFVFSTAMLKWKKTILNLFCLVGLILCAEAQNTQSYQKDTAKVMRLIQQAQMARFTNPGSFLPVAKEALQLAQSIKFREGEAEARLIFGEFHRVSGNFPEALQHLFVALRISREIVDSAMEGGGLTFIGIAYIELEEFRTGLDYLFHANEINKNRPNVNITAFCLTNIGLAYRQLGMLDSALIYQKRAWKVGKQMPLKAGIAFLSGETGMIYALQHKYDSALYYYRYGLSISQDVLNSGRIYSRMAMLYDQQNKPDSVLHYARLSLAGAQHSLQKKIMLEASRLLSEYFKGKHQLDSVIKYQALNMSLQDSLFGREQLRKLQLLAIEEQQKVYDVEQRQQQIQEEQTNFRNRVRFYILLGIVAMLLLLGFILYRNNRRKQLANTLLEKQKNETEKTLKELRDTQTQLIQTEKMASLGELTAGIAHEIQNPLNFVNNFSDVNNELIEEVKSQKSKLKGEELEELLNDIYQNNEKISYHGKRADAIVKGMLQHSRASSGQKEQTDINALCEEYLRLSYHGLRAKDKSFNAKFESNFDNSIGKINVIPQDIGRVILNLFNNAFYVVDEKRKNLGDGFEPLVTVSTRKLNGKVEVRVADNGNGIPPGILDKIFQPFFTTKPTGQGTGLGLSLSYDIVKAHGGELKVETRQDEGTDFIIQLPAN